MDNCIDAKSTLGNICRDTEVRNAAVDHEAESGDASLSVDWVPDLFHPTLHPTLVVDSGNNRAHKEQSTIQLFEPDQEHSEVQMATSGIADKQDCINSQSHSNRDAVSVGPKEAFRLEQAVIPLDESPPKIIDDSGISQLFCIENITASHDEAGPECSELAVPHSPNSVHLMDEEKTREEIDYPCEDFPSSQPPSSSPPHLFSSSPCASSQSSDNGADPSKKVQVFPTGREMEVDASPRGYAHDNHAVLVTQDESSSDSNHLLSCDATDVEAPSNYCLGADPTHRTVGDLGPSKKRIACASGRDSDESCGLPPTKHPKSDADLYLLPAPRRATLASHRRQFKKLASPFRLPTKIPVVRDEAVQTVKDKDTETTTNSTSKIGQGKSEPGVPATPPSRLQLKGSNASRSVGQFKSPLISKVLPGDSRTIRLTPTVQALERKLQLLKRAIKVREDNEEEILVRLVGKWVEAGREVAYELWDATKDAADLEGKATLVRKSYGWNNAENGDGHWGWDTKHRDTGEESSDPDSSMASCAAQRLTPEDDDDDEEVCNHTLGTMLRRLGIDPQTFGWDDDKEVFCD